MSSIVGPDGRPISEEDFEVHTIGDLKTKVFKDPGVIAIPITADGLAALIKAAAAKGLPKNEALKQAILVLSQNQGIGVQISGAIVRELAALRQRVDTLTATLADRTNNNAGAPKAGAELSDKPGGDPEASSDGDEAAASDKLH